MKPIPGLGAWEKHMVELGNKWCSYRDQQNIAGNFVDSWGWTGDAWFYDGGRSFESIDTYLLLPAIRITPTGSTAQSIC